MAQLPLLFVFLLLAGLDALAVLAGIERIGTASLPPLTAAAGIHLLVVFIAMAAVRLYPGAREREGITTLGLLATLLCLLTPIFGCLVSAWLLAGGSGKRAPSDPIAEIALGNPVTDAARRAHPEASHLSRPLVSALQDDHLPTLRLAAPLLRSSFDRRAIKALRRLRDRDDARTQLYAQSALTSMFENRERAIESLRKKVRDLAGDHPDALATREALASALRETARSGLRGPAESRDLLREAENHYQAALEIAPSDTALVSGKAHCLIELGELDAVPELYGRLCAQPGAEFHADRLELAYFAALGNWQRTTEAAMRLHRDRRDGGMNSGQRRFWLTRPVSA